MGRELVVQLASEGCSVATCDVHESAVQETGRTAELRASAGARATAHVCDVSDEDQGALAHLDRGSLNRLSDTSS